MKLYATIDGGTIVASIEKSFLPNDNWQEYEVDYVDQLVIVNNQIVVDKNTTK
jgi:sulfur carrier protein ThiS